VWGAGGDKEEKDKNSNGAGSDRCQEEPRGRQVEYHPVTIEVSKKLYGSYSRLILTVFWPILAYSWLLYRPLVLTHAGRQNTKRDFSRRACPKLEIMILQLSPVLTTSSHRHGG
jgi:hypothetical protein